MTPVSEEQIKMKMGDEKYPIYKAYTDAMNSFKPPFEVTTPNRFDMFDTNYYDPYNRTYALPTKI